MCQKGQALNFPNVNMGNGNAHEGNVSKGHE